jgi:2-keto-3-deoxy-galactonokinase
MCVGTPKIPTVPERQAQKLPDNGAPLGANRRDDFRRAMMAGMITSPQGVLGAPAVARPTLGAGGTANWYGGGAGGLR